MAKVAIIYFSQGGTTAQLAESVARGINAVGADVELYRVSPSDILDGRWQNENILTQLTAADTILFGAPTFMGGPAAQFKAFADATGYLWFGRKWKEKLAGGFTISSSPSGDKFNTLQYFNVLAAQHGMIWLNWDELPRQQNGTNYLGSFIGLMATAPVDANSALNANDVVSAEKYGKHIGVMTKKFIMH